mmetsp:Transcript_8973/g.19821  ORF Transcript_8973/g.19821 Transcript_8973/m.19821 type:complete len:238 (-) Transcript_8973:109-822(-)
MQQLVVNGEVMEARQVVRRHLQQPCHDFAEREALRVVGDHSLLTRCNEPAGHLRSRLCFWLPRHCGIAAVRPRKLRQGLLRDAEASEEDARRELHNHLQVSLGQQWRPLHRILQRLRHGAGNVGRPAPDLLSCDVADPWLHSKTRSLLGHVPRKGAQCAFPVAARDRQEGLASAFGVLRLPCCTKCNCNNQTNLRASGQLPNAASPFHATRPLGHLGGTGFLQLLSSTPLPASSDTD